MEQTNEKNTPNEGKESKKETVATGLANKIGSTS